MQGLKESKVDGKAIIGLPMGIELRDQRGRTPLQLASRYGRLSTVRRLLEAGASPLSQAPLGRTRLICKAESDPNLIRISSGR